MPTTVTMSASAANTRVITLGRDGWLPPDNQRAATESAGRADHELQPTSLGRQSHFREMKGREVQLENAFVFLIAIGQITAH